jgi:DNA-binding transcriptional ArsR family regulator
VDPRWIGTCEPIGHAPVQLLVAVSGEPLAEVCAHEIDAEVSHLEGQQEAPAGRGFGLGLHAANIARHDGQTLSELCQHLDMTRQGVTQHLAVLEAAHLVAVQWRGREKLHFLNPVPPHEIYDRWIRKFEPRLKALRDSKRRLEEGLAVENGRPGRKPD